MNENEKICPFMSGVVCAPGYWSNEHKDITHSSYPQFVPCQKEKCMAWVPKDSCGEAFCLLIGDYPKED